MKWWQRFNWLSGEKEKALICSTMAEFKLSTVTDHGVCCTSLFSTSAIGTDIISTSQRRHRRVNRLAQGHRVRSWAEQGFGDGQPDLEICVLSPTTSCQTGLPQSAPAVQGLLPRGHTESPPASVPTPPRHLASASVAHSAYLQGPCGQLSLHPYFGV